MKNINFNNYKDRMNDDDIDQIVELFSYKCRAHTANLIRNNLNCCASLIPNYGILERVMKEGTSWSYCAGQSYPDEIRTIRKIFKTLK